MAHTPTIRPWKLGKDSRISDAQGNTVADCRYKSNQGSVIVTAVNAFQPMREALRSFLAYYESDFIRVSAEDGRTLAEQIRLMSEALALADEGEPKEPNLAQYPLCMCNHSFVSHSAGRNRCFECECRRYEPQPTARQGW